MYVGAAIPFIVGDTYITSAGLLLLGLRAITVDLAVSFGYSTADSMQFPAKL